MSETEGMYTAKAHCQNCDRSGTVSPCLGNPLSNATCPCCGCIGYLEPLESWARRHMTLWSPPKLTGWN